MFGMRLCLGLLLMGTKSLGIEKVRKSLKALLFLEVGKIEQLVVDHC